MLYLREGALPCEVGRLTVLSRFEFTYIAAQYLAPGF